MGSHPPWGPTNGIGEFTPVISVEKKLTLWWTNIAVENHHFWWENPLFLWPCSIAMLVHQRVKQTSHVFPRTKAGWTNTQPTSWLFGFSSPSSSFVWCFTYPKIAISPGSPGTGADWCRFFLSLSWVMITTKEKQAMRGGFCSHGEIPGRKLRMVHFRENPSINGWWTGVSP